MDNSVKKMWVAALRSGDYRKGKYLLRDLDDHYDIQGVLCELAIEAGVPIKRVKHARIDGEGQFFGYTYRDPQQNHSLATGLPAAVCEWAGLPYRKAWTLALRCDEGMSFNKAADHIEKEF